MWSSRVLLVEFSPLIRFIILLACAQRFPAKTRSWSGEISRNKLCQQNALFKSINKHNFFLYNERCDHLLIVTFLSPPHYFLPHSETLTPAPFCTLHNFAITKTLSKIEKKLAPVKPAAIGSSVSLTTIQIPHSTNLKKSWLCQRNKWLFPDFIWQLDKLAFVSGFGETFFSRLLRAAFVQPVAKLISCSPLYNWKGKKKDKVAL